MSPDDRTALADLLAAAEDYLMLLGRVWRGELQAIPPAKRERFIDALHEVVRRAHR